MAFNAGGNVVINSAVMVGIKDLNGITLIASEEIQLERLTSGILSENRNKLREIFHHPPIHSLHEISG